MRGRAMREPLPGTHVTVHGRGELRGGGVSLHAWPDGVWQARTNGPRPARVGADDLPSAQLAAEDAARAMVADMAAALGGSVTWNESEASDGH